MFKKFLYGFIGLLISLLPIVSDAQISWVDTNAGKLAHWDFQHTNSAGNFVDVWSNLVLTNFGSTSIAIGTNSSFRVERAISLNGSSSYLDGGNICNFNTTNTMTICAWIIPTTGSENGGVAGRWGTDLAHHQYCLLTENGAYFTIDPESSTKAVARGNNVLIHITGTIDGSNVHLYTNGVQVTPAVAKSTALAGASTTQFIVGKLRPADSVYSFSGILKDIRVYNTALSSNAISAIVQNTSPWSNIEYRAQTLWYDPYRYTILIECEQTNGNATVDTSGRGYDMTNMTATKATWTIVGTNQNDYLEHGWTFDGTQYFRGPQILNGATQCTWFAWVKPTAGVQAYSGVIGEANVVNGLSGLYISGASKFSCEVCGASGGSYVTCPAPVDFNYGDWVFVWARWKIGYPIELYTNGVLSATSTVYSSAINTTKGCIMGNSDYSFFVGGIDGAGMHIAYDDTNEMTQIYHNTSTSNNIRDRSNNPSVAYVSSTATGANSGVSWVHAYNTLTNALTNSAGEFWVTGGTNNPGTVNPSSFNLGTNYLYGGFVGTETVRTQRDWNSNISILDNVISVTQQTHMITKYVGNLAIIDGFTIRNANDQGYFSSYQDQGLGGGAIYVSAGNVLVQNCIFTNNYSQGKGGVLYSPFGWNDTNNYGEIWNYGTNSAGIVGNINGIIGTNMPVGNGLTVIMVTNQYGWVNDYWQGNGAANTRFEINQAIVNGSGNYTLGAWFKIDVNVNSQCLIGQSDVTGNHVIDILYDWNNPSIQFKTYEGGYVTVTQNWNYDTNWHFVVCIKSNTTGYVYLDDLSTSGPVANVVGGNLSEIGGLGAGSSTRIQCWQSMLDAPFFVQTNINYNEYQEIRYNSNPTNCWRRNLHGNTNDPTLICAYTNTFANCTFIDNYAGKDGGCFNTMVPLLVTNCTFVNSEDVGNPIAWWQMTPFDTNTLGQVTDATGNGNNASNMPDVTTGPSLITTNGGYYRFDGANDHFDAGVILGQLTNTLAISMWIDMEVGSATRYFFTKFVPGTVSWQFVYDNNQSAIRIYVNQSDGTSIEATLANNLTYTSFYLKWMHLVLTADGTTLSVYTNGILACTNAYNGTIRAGATHAVVLGGYNGMSGDGWEGLIDDVRTFNSLTPQQVTNIYNKTRSNYSTGKKIIGNGGILYNNSESVQSIFSNCTFSSCYSIGNGGVVYVNGVGDTNIFYSCTFTNNTALNGGAIYANSNTTVTLQNSSLLRNLATISGGAIYQDTNGLLQISSCNFFTNTVLGYNQGGAIYSQGGAIYSKGQLSIAGNTNNFAGNSVGYTNGMFTNQYPIWLSATMTASNLPSPVVVVGDSYDDVSEKPWNASDRDYNTRWQTTSSAFPHWWRYYCGSGISNICLQLAFRNYLAYGINVFTLIGSNATGSGTTVLTGNGANSDLLQIFTVTNPGYYQYYILNVTSGYGGDPGFLLVREIELSSALAIPIMTGSNTPSPFVVSASTYYDVGGNHDFPWKATDRDETTFWSSTITPFPCWLEYDLGTNTIVSAYTIINYPSSGINAFSFQGSSNNTDWITIEIATAANVSTEQYYTNNNVAAYRYYRLYATSGYGSYAKITEWRIFRSPTIPLVLPNVGGGAIYASGNTTNVIYNSDFIGNKVSGGGVGGAIWVNSINTNLFKNCSFIANVSDYNGSAIYFGTNGVQNVINCTFLTNNSGYVYSVGAGTIGSVSAPTIGITNSIFWGNISGTGATNIQQSAGILTISYSDINTSNFYIYCGGTETLGTGIINSDPLFASIVSPYDVREKSIVGRYLNGTWINDLVNSPALDAGNPSDDYSNEPLPNGSRINIGRYGNTVEASESNASGGSPYIGIPLRNSILLNNDTCIEF